MSKTEVAKYLLRFSWMPVLFGVVGVVFPFPYFSLHGGPAWLVYYFLFVFIVGFYVSRIFIAPRQQRLHYLGLNAISLLIFVTLLGISGHIVSKAVMSN